MSKQLEDYKELTRILSEAHQQSSQGKGKERHANDLPFQDQPIMKISSMLSGIGGHSFQVMKKIQEASTMVDRDYHDPAIHELRGAIIYCAAAILQIENIRNEYYSKMQKPASVEKIEVDDQEFEKNLSEALKRVDEVDPTGGAE